MRHAGQSSAIDRRILLRRVGLLGSLATVQRLARASGWMPYPEHQVTLIRPRLTGAVVQPQQPVRTVRIAPVITDFQANAALHRTLTQGRRQQLPALPGNPPRAYMRVGAAERVDPWLLFGVALQESRIKFGQRTLPYPWTLCVRGRGERHANYEQTLAALSGYVRRGVTNVDCGAMQVNWYWHSNRLGSFARALDPYPNLYTGARILRGHYERQGNWHRAVALYHTGAWDTKAKRNRGMHYANQTFARLAQLGLSADRFDGEPGHG